MTGTIKGKFSLDIVSFSAGNTYLGAAGLDENELMGEK